MYSQSTIFSFTKTQQATMKLTLTKSLNNVRYKRNQIATVLDEVQLFDGQFGIVRFIGEMQENEGIYYGIELEEPNGTSNGTANNVQYFNCKPGYGVFLQHSAIKYVVENDEISKIGIEDTVKLFIADRKAYGTVCYIGTPSYQNEVHYGIKLNQPIGDNDGIYNGIRYFRTNENFAYFAKASEHIIKVSKQEAQDEDEKIQQSTEKHKEEPMNITTISLNGEKSKSPQTQNSQKNNIFKVRSRVRIQIPQQNSNTKPMGIRCVYIMCCCWV